MDTGHTRVFNDRIRRAATNRRLAQWRVKWLIEHSTSHQLLWFIDSFVLRNPPLRQAPKRCAQVIYDHPHTDIHTMIILDTNIWYKISSGEIQLDDKEKDKICLTPLVLMEIMSTPRWTKPNHLEQMKSVLKTIRDLTPRYIEHMPFEFLSISVFGINKEKFNGLSYDCIEESINNNFAPEIRSELISTRKFLTDDFVINFNLTTEKIKRNLDLMQKLNRYEDFVHLVLNDILSEVENVSGIKRIEWNQEYINANIDNIHCYVNTRYHYYRQIALGKYSVKRNDFFDLLNLVYVNKEDQYWTKDGKWTNRYMFAEESKAFLKN